VLMAMPPAAALQLANERGIAALLIENDGQRLLVRPSTTWPGR
jgi:hypothetical protein